MKAREGLAGAREVSTTAGPAAAAATTAPIAAPFWPGLNGVLWTISIAAMAIGWASAALAWHNWRATRDEKPGAGHALVDAGEGRTRFLALCGLIVGCCFALALLWTASGLLLVPACGA